MAARRSLSIYQRAIQERKSIGMSLSAVSAAIKSKGEFRSTLTSRIRGCTVGVTIRCKRLNLPQAWEMCLVANSVAVDKIDFHRKAWDESDITSVGWHKHVWREEQRTCAPYRQKLPEFCPDTVDDFLREGFRIWRIDFSERDDDDGQQVF